MAKVGEEEIVVQAPKLYADEVATLADDCMDLWLSKNDRRYIINRLANDLAAGGGVREIVKAYGEQIKDGRAPAGTYAPTALLKTTAYEYFRGFGSQFKWDIELDIHQMILSLLGAGLSKVGRVNVGAQWASVYLIPSQAANVKVLKGLSFFFRKFKRSLEIPESVKALMAAYVAFKAGDLSDLYGEELVVVESGNRATLFRREGVSSWGFVRALEVLTSRSGQPDAAKGWVLATLGAIMDVYACCFDIQGCEKIVACIEEFSQRALGYVSTGSPDYQYMAVSHVARVEEELKEGEEGRRAIGIAARALKERSDRCREMGDGEVKKMVLEGLSGLRSLASRLPPVTKEELGL